MKEIAVFSACGIFEPAVNAYCDHLFESLRAVFGEIKQCTIRSRRTAKNYGLPNGQSAH